jgi:hypothetical protein
VSSRRCGTCRHHGRPTWDTGGFGTCSFIAKGLVRIVNRTENAYLATHESFGCSFWTAPRPAPPPEQVSLEGRDLGDEDDGGRRVAC